MKRLAIVVGLLTCILVGACGTPDVDSNTDLDAVSESGWKDGTYTETAAGRNGRFDVTVVIEEGLIRDIIVGSNQETPDYGGIVFAKLPTAIIEAQSTDVDGIAGATITSDAVKEAVKGCLNQALT